MATHYTGAELYWVCTERYDVGSTYHFRFMNLKCLWSCEKRFVGDTINNWYATGNTDLAKICLSLMWNIFV
jgi:hypothetical protein